MARDFKAFCRARKFKTVAQLLRAVMLFAGLDWSECEVAANLVLTDPTITSVTDEAVRHRLAACQPWLRALLPKLLKRAPLPALPSHLRLLVIDAPAVVAQGQHTTSYRLAEETFEARFTLKLPEDQLAQCIPARSVLATLRIVVPLPDARQQVQIHYVGHHKLQPRWHGVDGVDVRQLQHCKVIGEQPA